MPSSQKKKGKFLYNKQSFFKVF